MKLIYRIVLRLAAVLTLLLAGWALLFHLALIKEINDEVDDALETYSEELITRALAGRQLPSVHDGSNNSYFIAPVSPSYAAAHKRIEYADRQIFVPDRDETEPARTLTTVFRNAQGEYFELTVLTPTIEKDDMLGAIARWIVLLYAALLLMLVGINAWVFYLSMRPLYVLLRWLDDYRMGARNLPLDNPTRITEFRRLNEAARRNAQRAERLFEEQKLFIANASHEIQTPLAVCRNRLEMLVNETQLSEEQLCQIEKTQQTLTSIMRLTRSLLLLTKIDNGQAAPSQSVEVNELVARLAADYCEVYAYRDIRLQIEQRGRAQVLMDPELADVLFSNLLRNAFVHGPQGGTVKVGIEAQRFTVHNPGAEPLDASRIFERLYRDGERKGSGLGLALVDAVCRLYRLPLHYSHAQGMHCFEVLFTT